jgi:hypothetical protein
MIRGRAVPSAGCCARTGDAHKPISINDRMSVCAKRKTGSNRSMTFLQEKMKTRRTTRHLFIAVVTVARQRKVTVRTPARLSGDVREERTLVGVRFKANSTSVAALGVGIVMWASARLPCAINSTRIPQTELMAQM